MGRVAAVSVAVVSVAVVSVVAAQAEVGNSNVVREIESKTDASTKLVKTGHAHSLGKSILAFLSRFD